MRRSAWFVSFALLTLAASAFPQEAYAQRRGLRVVRGTAPEIGPRVGYDFDADAWSVGGQLRVPWRRLELLLSGDYYFSTAGQENLDLVLHFGRFSSLYAGGGVGMFHELGTSLGPNIVVGLHPPARGGSPIRPYAEGRWSFLDYGTPFRLVFGVNLALGR